MRFRHLFDGETSWNKFQFGTPARALPLCFGLDLWSRDLWGDFALQCRQCTEIHYPGPHANPRNHTACIHPCIHDARVCLLVVWPSLPNTSNLDFGCTSIPHISLRRNERLSWHHFGLPDAWLLRDRHMQGPKGVTLLTKRHPWSMCYEVWWFLPGP